MNIIFFSILALIAGFIAAQIIYRKKIKSICSKIPPAEPAGPAPKESLEYSESEDKLWHEEETRFIFDLNEQLSLTFERDKVARYIVEGVDKFLDPQRTILLLLDEDNGQLRIEYAIGLNKDVIENFFLKKDESISGFVISGRRPLLVNDLNKEAYLKSINKEEYLKESFISTPLISQEKILGILHVCDKKPDRIFTKRDFALMANVNKVSAIALQSALLHKQIQNDYLRTIAAFASAIDARDHYTRRHSENVTRYSLAIAKEMKFTRYETEVLRRAALLHDIGKIGIRDDVLLKAGKLTPEEFEQIKLHPAKGEEILKPLSFLKEASVLIRHHHEKHNGLGYPDGIAGERIELGAKILAVTDAFDAMTSDRLYRKALSLSETKNELNSKKGSQFDPTVADCFLKILEQNPGILQTSET